MTSTPPTSHTPSATFSERMKHPDADRLMWLAGGVICTIPLVVMGLLTIKLLPVAVIGICTIVALAVYMARFYQEIGQKLSHLNIVEGDGTVLTLEERINRRPSFFFEKVLKGHFSDIVALAGHGETEVGTFNEVFDYKGNTHIKSRGYIRIKLPRHLPHMLLDSRHDDVFGFSWQFRGVRGERVRLEGDFNRYFRLIVPHGYTKDALYIFTPDIMQLLVDSAHRYDCEIVEDNFYIHSERVFSVTDSAELDRLLVIVEKIRQKLGRRTDYYADDRVGDRTLNTVTRQGIRLRQHTSLATLIATLAVGAYMLLLFLYEVVGIG